MLLYAKASAYYFYVKTKISVDFQICISVHLSSFNIPFTLITVLEFVADISQTSKKLWGLAFFTFLQLSISPTDI